MNVSKSLWGEDKKGMVAKGRDREVIVTEGPENFS